MSPRPLRAWTHFAWRAWRDPDVEPPRVALPIEDVRLLGLGPLVFHALRARGDERAAGLTDLHRASAGANLVAFARVARARDALRQHGIAPVLIKGGAFLLRHSAVDVGVRTLADLDLLVEGARFDEALEVLRADGWHAAFPGRARSGRVAPAIGLLAAGAGGAAVQLDLHRHLTQWPLLRALAPRVLAGAETVGGWAVPTARHAVLIVALHRARHAFANDARDLFDLAADATSLGDDGWRSVVEEAEELGLTGALYGALHQAAWWLGDAGIARRASGAGERLGPVRRRVIARMADPSFVLTQRSPWMGPLGRNLGVFPAALHAPFASLAAAALYLPARAIEGR